MMSQIADVLIVEDDPLWLDKYKKWLVSKEYQITTARTVREVSNLLDQREFAVVATDLKLLGSSDTLGFDILSMVLEHSPDTQVIIFTGYGSQEYAFQAMQKGAYDFVTKPLDYDKVKQVIKSAIMVREEKLSYRQAQILNQLFPEEFVGNSQVIKNVLNRLANVTNSTGSVLVWGASGTGKALITETIHLASNRKRFFVVNCAGYSETTLARTLFGFQKGAFPRALEDEPGLLEQASESTLVLDNINELSRGLQSQLNSVFRHQCVQRIGGDQMFEIDVRILATSQVDLAPLVAQGFFSKELYEYLSDSVIEVPLLRERRDDQIDDVLLLTESFLAKYAPKNSPKPDISAETKSLLKNYHFPGNVRELKNAIQVAITKTKSGIIEPHHLQDWIQARLESTKLVDMLRAPLLENIICPHGYPLSNQADTIAKIFDTANYVYLSVGAGLPAWHQVVVVDTLADYGLKLSEVADLPGNKNFCSICEKILSSQMAIFDISELNPATFYELGLANAIGLSCLVLKEKRSRIPKYFESMRYLEYYDAASLQKSIATWLNQLNSSVSE